MSEELKPCPWQMPGEEVHEVTILKNDLIINGIFFEIVCSCGISTNDNFESIEEAVQFWNRRASPWVKVEDGLPPNYRQVFVLDEIYGEARGILDNHDEWFHIFRDSHCKCENVSHWMPIPPLGEENE